MKSSPVAAIPQDNRLENQESADGKRFISRPAKSESGTFGTGTTRTTRRNEMDSRKTKKRGGCRGMEPGTGARGGGCQLYSSFVTNNFSKILGVPKFIRMVRRHARHA